MLLPVIMAGGTGSRLWPMSRELYPKQFLRLYGQNSMLQETITRLSGLEIHEPMVICNERAPLHGGRTAAPAQQAVEQHYS